MIITVKWLENNDVCINAIYAFKHQKECDAIKLVKKLITTNKLIWANWLIVRLMGYEQYVSYAVFAAEQVLPIYEKNNKGDKPRLAIEAAKSCILENSKENRATVLVAGNAAREVMWTVTESAAVAATVAAAWTASTSVNAAAAESTIWAVKAAVETTEAEGVKMFKKILRYGLKLLQEKI